MTDISSYLSSLHSELKGAVPPTVDMYINVVEGGGFKYENKKKSSLKTVFETIRSKLNDLNECQNLNPKELKDRIQLLKNVKNDINGLCRRYQEKTGSVWRKIFGFLGYNRAKKETLDEYALLSQEIEWRLSAYGGKQELSNIGSIEEKVWE